MGYKELSSNLITFQSKLNAHLQERNSYNINEEYVAWLEHNIEEIKKLIQDLKLSEKKAS